MLQILIGWVGFTFRRGTIKGRIGSTDEDKKAIAVLIFLGIIGFAFWNRAASKLYGKCLRISVSDAEMIYNSGRLIRERSDKMMQEERKRWEETTDERDKRIYKLNDDLMEKRSEISRLQTTIKEMMRISEQGECPPCEACGEPVPDEDNVGLDCNLHSRCAVPDPPWPTGRAAGELT